MRACMSLLLALVLASVGPQPPVAFSQPQTTSGGNPPPCGCPQIPAIATSDKPDPRKLPGELTFADLELWWSNREAQYGGDWDRALVALAHEVDPSGGLHIWTKPAPAPSNRSTRIQEGVLAHYLLTGQDRLPGDRRPNQLKYSRFGGSHMGELIELIARSNKYGEPAFGLRKAAIRIARFLAGDLANAGRRKDLVKGTTAQRAALLGSDAQIALMVATGDARFDRPEPQRVQMARAHNQLFLDRYDLANAVLDIVLSVDDKGRREVALPLLFNFNRNASGGSHGTGIDSLGIVLGLAGRRRVFGGTAQPGSPADAVACRAFAALATLADFHSANGPEVRQELVSRSWEPNGLPYVAVAGAAIQVFKSAHAALVLAGLNQADPTAEWAKLMYAAVEQAVLHHERQGTLDLALTAMRNLMTYGKGPGKPLFVSGLEKRFAALRSNIQHDVEEDQKPLEQRRYYIPGFREDLTKWGFISGPPLDGMQRNGYLFGPPGSEHREPPERLLKAWQAAVSDYNPQDVDPFCPPAAATPRIIIFAKGVNGRIMIKKLYVGVPTTLGLMFPEPYDGESYPVKIQTGGGELSLTARPTDEQHLLFETEEFVVTPK